MAVSIDYLCFTMKVKDLRHCARATYMDTHQHDPDVMKKSRRNTLMINPIARFFPQEPVFNTDFRARSAEDIEAYRNFFRIQYQEYLDRCLSLFVTHVLGLTMNAPRGFGFQFYTESMKLTTADGEDFCGFVGIGGNQDTVHFQINGTGCKHMFAKLQAWEFLLNTALGLSQASASFLLGTYRLNVRTLFVRILCDLVCHLCLGYYEFLLEHFLGRFLF